MIVVVFRAVALSDACVVYQACVWAAEMETESARVCVMVRESVSVRACLSLYLHQCLAAVCAVGLASFLVALAVVVVVKKQTPKTKALEK